MIANKNVVISDSIEKAPQGAIPVNESQRWRRREYGTNGNNGTNGRVLAGFSSFSVCSVISVISVSLFMLSKSLTSLTQYHSFTGIAARSVFPGLFNSIERRRAGQNVTRISN
ncbi:MAG: hypothetical protein ACREEM_35450 [Blastocatellia bacterium]